MPQFRLTLAYDGTGLVGWQRQADGTSVQGLVEDALAVLEGQAVTLTGAGRTDAGVHALGQVASVALSRPIDAATLVRALNFHLPPAVRVVEAVEVAADFHARFHARSKVYRYQIWTGGPMPPFIRAFAWHLAGPLDIGRMDEAARLLEGRHDFAAFQSAGTDVPDTVRELFSSRVGVAPHACGVLQGLSAECGHMVTYEVCGSGFLRHMVRAIAGTIADVGVGRLSIDAFADILASRDRARAGRTAPAEGLVLVRVSF